MTDLDISLNTMKQTEDDDKETTTTNLMGTPPGDVNQTHNKKKLNLEQINLDNNILKWNWGITTMERVDFSIPIFHRPSKNMQY